VCISIQRRRPSSIQFLIELLNDVTLIRHFVTARVKSFFVIMKVAVSCRDEEDGTVMPQKFWNLSFSADIESSHVRNSEGASDSRKQ
jgi:hypothetical protein